MKPGPAISWPVGLSAPMPPGMDGYIPATDRRRLDDIGVSGEPRPSCSYPGSAARSTKLKRKSPPRHRGISRVSRNDSSFRRHKRAVFRLVSTEMATDNEIGRAAGYVEPVSE